MGFSLSVAVLGKEFFFSFPNSCLVGMLEGRGRMSDAPIRQAKAKLNDVIVELLLGSLLTFRLPYWIH